jgi:membrane protein implicated in regulation of membrane protease activity
MAQTDPHLKRSIGLAGVIRWLIAVMAAIALGAGLADGNYPLAIASFVFLVVAVALGYRAWRARQSAGPAGPPHTP